MAGIKINGDTSGSTTITAPDTGTDETIELSTALASKLDLAGGKILQIVRATDGTERSTTTTGSFVDASISVTITPQKSDSAVLLIWNVNGETRTTVSLDDQRMEIGIADSSNNAVAGAEGQFVGINGKTGSGTQQWMGSVQLIGYATPATTSPVTYKGRFRSLSATSTAYIRNSLNTGQLFALEISA